MSLDGVRFRMAGPTDADQLADLRWRLKTDDAPDFDTAGRARFTKAFLEAASRVDESLFHWVADLDGQIVAVMSIASRLSR